MLMGNQHVLDHTAKVCPVILVTSDCPRAVSYGSLTVVRKSGSAEISAFKMSRAAMLIASLVRFHA